jgi:SPX domain protein involved in polyphosphate accumulation
MEDGHLFPQETWCDLQEGSLIVKLVEKLGASYRGNIILTQKGIELLPQKLAAINIFTRQDQQRPKKNDARETFQQEDFIHS